MMRTVHGAGGVDGLPGVPRTRPPCLRVPRRRRLPARFAVLGGRRNWHRRNWCRSRGHRGRRRWSRPRPGSGPGRAAWLWQRCHRRRWRRRWRGSRPDRSALLLLESFRRVRWTGVVVLACHLTDRTDPDVSRRIVQVTRSTPEASGENYGVKTILPVCVPSTIAAKPSLALASGMTRSISGRVPVCSQKRSSRPS